MSFQDLAKSVRPKLLALCRSFFNRQEIAYDENDAVQETFMHLWQMRDRLKDYEDPESLSILIAKNICIDMLKRADTNHEQINEENDVAEQTMTDQKAIMHDTKEMIGQALARIPNAQRRMLIMRSSGMSLTEIATACDTTVASVKTMISSARKRMMELLKIRRSKNDRS